jgi:hypothetical protein
MSYAPRANYWVALRCEWAKSRARANRWSEEVTLLTEEMRRVVVFLRWKADWWSLQGKARTVVSAGLAEGLRSYAAKQEHLYNSLAESFSAMWSPVLFANDIPVGWPLVSEFSFTNSVTIPDSDHDNNDDEVLDNYADLQEL